MLHGIDVLRIDGDLCCKIECSENPDWGFARNRQLIIKSVLAEYSASVFNTSINSSVGLLYGGNRDYHWQGLIVGPVNGRLVKIVDGVYYKPIDDDIVKPISALSCTDRIIYEYMVRDGYYTVSLILRDCRGFVEFTVEASKPSFLAFLLDFRDAESTSNYRYILRKHEGRVEIVSDSLLRAVVDGFDDFESWDLWLSWRYKLGDGFREVRNGVLRFIEHIRPIHIPAVFKSLRGRLTLRIPLSIEEYCKPILNMNLAINAEPMVRDLVEMRIRRMAGFGVLFNSLVAPEAGSWWFRRVWIRDLVEGLRWNMKTYIYVLGWGSWLSRLVVELLRISWINGGTPILTSSKSFSSDAFPQLINVAVELSRLTGNIDVLRSALKLMFKAFQELRRNGFSASKLIDGVIASKPSSSWIDSIVNIDGVEWPMRLPLSWIGRVGGEYALVEVNSLYLEAVCRLLSSLKSFNIPTPTWLKDFQYELMDGFKKWFGSSGLPPLTINIPSRLIDNTLSSASVLAVSVLTDIIYDRECVGNAWRDVEKLIVKRRLRYIGDEVEIFGLLTRMGDLKPYIGDMEYHGSVVWPRDTPYLIKIMETLSIDVKGVLLNNLDHMVYEGAVGYVNELFSLPIGINPNPSVDSTNPIPVKNPAQYWSQWCDPYLDYYSSIKSIVDPGISSLTIL